MANRSVEELWEAYQEKDAAARLRLIEHYLPLVKRICSRLSVRMPQYVDRGDLENAGVLGLMDAIGNFNPERGTKFETFAAARIRGAIIDNLRNIDFVPRSVRQKAKRLQEVIQSLQARLGRSATETEMAAELGLTLTELQKWLLDVQAITVLSLNMPLDTGEGADLGSLLEADSGGDPAARILEKELQAELAAAIGKLSEREQLVLSLYYEQGLTLKELGLVLGVSESRVSQIHTAIMLKLRTMLGEGGKA